MNSLCWVTRRFVEGALGLLLLFGVCACDDPLAHLKIGKPVEKEDSGKSSGGQKRKVPEMGACQVIGVKVEELSGLCMTKDSTALWAVGDEDSPKLYKFSFEF